MSSLRVSPTTDHAPDETESMPRSKRTGEAAAAVSADVADSAPSVDVIPELRHERFRIGEKLGEGGMGVVYRAVDARDGRALALKLMKGSLAGTARRRFEREFRSLQALRHPHCLGDLARALLDASLVIPEKADQYRRRGHQLLDQLGAVVPEAERLPPTS